MMRCYPDIGEGSYAYKVVHQHFGSTHENVRLCVSYGFFVITSLQVITSFSKILSKKLLDSLFVDHCRSYLLTLLRLKNNFAKHTTPHSILCHYALCPQPWFLFPM